MTSQALRKSAWIHQASSPAVVERLDELIGNTPLIRLKHICPSGNLFAKLEWYNPAQSAKDRPAWNIIRHALETGKLGRGQALLDASSGNTGIAYAMLGAILKFEVHLCVPANASPERLRTLRAYGAHLILTDASLSSDGAIMRARQLHKQNPKGFFYADQYSNPENWRAHFNTTGPEIYTQTQGEVRYFVACLGTSGTFMGCGRYLKQRNASIKIAEVQPDAAFHGLEGMKHMESAIVPAFYDPNLADIKMTAGTEESQALVVELAKKEGLFAGVSCGAALACAKKLALRYPQEKVVTIFPDGGSRYLSERFWEESPASSSAVSLLPDTL